MVRSFDTPINTNDQSIDRVLSAGLPVLLVFLNGDAQGPLAGTLERLARDYSGQILIARIQVKDNPESVRRYEIRQTPAVVAIRNGQVLTKAEGITAAGLEKHAAYLLGKGPKPETQPRPTSAGADRPVTGDAVQGRPIVITDSNFEQEVLRSSSPVLVDFWAPWCGPCRITEPIVEKLAGELGSRLKVAKMNVDENPVVPQRYGVQSIPTMMVVKNGQVVDRWVGALPEPAMRARITPVLK
jgi:thioredoxin 1